MYAIHNAAGQTVAKARSREAAHRATRRSRGVGGGIAKIRAEQEKFGEEVRLTLRQLGAKEGYVVFTSHGPYDHNQGDFPLPSPAYPRVFRALYEAVEYAQAMKEWGRIKIDRVDGSVLPGTRVLSSTVVWRSWTPGEHGGWANRAGLSQSAKRSAMVRGTFADYEVQARARQQQPTMVTGRRQTLAMTPGGTVVMERPNFAGVSNRRRSFAEARAGILQFLRSEGWRVKGDLKYPHAVSGDGRTHLYFKPQAVYVGTGGGGMGNTRSMWVDIRDVDGPAFLSAVETAAR
jgi:hypothetical protein